MDFDSLKQLFKSLRSNDHDTRIKDLAPRMSRARHQLLSIGTRQSLAHLMSREISYWSDTDETLLGLVFVDVTDGDYGTMIMHRDRIGRFRSCEVDVSIRSRRQAEKAVRGRIAELARDGVPDDFGHQGDEPNAPYDVLSSSVVKDDAALHPFFVHLRDHPSKAPARAVLREIGPWLAPSDPHFIREFQTNGFDQRIWELYLWATLREAGFDVEQPEAPDFLCGAPGLSFTVEATTVGPSMSGPLAEHPSPSTPEEFAEFNANYMALKFGSALMSKLEKRNAAGEPYWDRPETKDKPFLIALADFHIPGGTETGPASMTYSSSALWPYLYGHRIVWYHDDDGNLVIQAVPGADLAYGPKRAPTGYFDQPGSENISAILFSNAGTIPKFDRMGLAAGFEAPGFIFQRVGFRTDPDPNATVGIPFSQNVQDEGYTEFWGDELQVFHNPNARNPLPVGAFPGAQQHFFENGDQHTVGPSGSVLSSLTLVTGIRSEPAAA